MYCLVDQGCSSVGRVLSEHASLHLIPSSAWTESGATPACHLSSQEVEAAGLGSSRPSTKIQQFKVGFPTEDPVSKEEEEEGKGEGKEKGKKEGEKEEEKNRRRKRNRRRMKRRKNHQLFNKINASCDFLRLKENAGSLWLHVLVERKCVYKS